MAIKKISANLLGNNAVTAASIAGGAISAADIANNSITAAKLSASTSPTFGGLTATGSSKDLASQYANILITSSDAVAADKGGSIGFGGLYDGSLTTQWAGITGRKYDGTEGNYGGYLTLNTRPNGGQTAERMRITSTGNVGIGTSSPAAYLGFDAEAYQNGTEDSTSIRWNDSGTADSIVQGYSIGTDGANLWLGANSYVNSSGGISAFDTTKKSAYVSVSTYAGGLAFGSAASGNPTEAMRIDSSGNVGIGTASPTSKLTLLNNTQDGTTNIRQYATFGPSNSWLDSDTLGWAGAGIGEVQIHNGTASRPPILSLGGSLAAGELLGAVNFFRSSNTDTYRQRAYIASGLTSSGTADQYGADLRFATAANGATSPSTRMTITSSGTVYAKSSSGVVTDGLVTHLEVLNADSYPGSGSTWYDLAGNNNASLTNFSYNYKDHFDITNTGYTGMTNPAYGQSSCTVCVLMSTNDTQAVTFVGNNPNAYIGAWEDTGTQNFYHNASGTVTYYINGEQTSAWTNRRNRARGKWMWIEMKNVDFTSSYWTTLNFNGYGGSYVMTNYNSVVGAILVYNKSLSDAERQQNFAYIRRTYGETPDWATQVIQPTLNSPYSNYGGSYAPMEYYKDTTGHVHVTGLMFVASATQAIPFTMPVGYRPKNTIMFDSNSQSPGEGIMAWDLTNAGYWTPRRTVNGWTNIDAIYYPDGE